MKIKKTLNFKGPINVHHDHIRSLKKINKYLIKISILLAQGVIIIINFTADTANNFPKSFKVSAILNTPQVYLKWKLV